MYTIVEDICSNLLEGRRRLGDSIVCAPSREARGPFLNLHHILLASHLVEGNAFVKIARCFVMDQTVEEEVIEAIWVHRVQARE